MRINYVMMSVGLTGGNRTFFEISDRLIERGHEVAITTLGTPFVLDWFKPKAKLIFVEKFPFLRKSIQMVSNKLPGYLSGKIELTILNHQLKVLADNIPECDINVATLCHTAYSVLRSGKGIPFYQMQHYEPLFASNAYMRKMAEGTYSLPLNRIANSTWLRSKLEEMHGIKNVPVVNHAIDHAIFYPRNKSGKRDKFRVVSLGKLADWKGIFDLFEAIKIVTAKRKDVEFILYGRHSLPGKFSDIPHKFVRSPSDNDLAELYSNSDLLVSASWYESFPLPPLEGMACGLPVVTTPYGTEDYAFDGRNAVVIPPRNPKALAEAVIKLMDDKTMRDKLTEEGLKTAKQFTWDRTTDKVEALFKAAVHNAK